MRQSKPVRVIKKRDQHSRSESAVVAGTGKSGTDLERNVKTAIAGWVREHRQRAEELRRDHAALLAGLGFCQLGPSAR